jgi:hypothetical protein
MTDAKRKAGRQSLWRPEYVEHVRKMALLGWTEKEIAKNLQVSLSTFNNWKRDYPDLLEALRHKDIADAEVLNAIYKAAINGNVMAGMYWLNNRQRTRFSRNPDPITDPDEPLPQSVKVTVEDASVNDAKAE